MIKMVVTIMKPKNMGLTYEEMYKPELIRSFIES
jgi:hypothetical protein